MTTSRDLDVLADANAHVRDGESMKICNKCGWYALMNHAARCNPASGRMAQRLFQALPGTRSGQLGYGDGSAVFDIDRDFTVRFEVSSRGHHGRAFSLREVHRLGGLTVSESADLVTLLTDWHNNLMVRRANDGTDDPEKDEDE